MGDSNFACSVARGHGLCSNLQGGAPDFLPFPVYYEIAGATALLVLQQQLLLVACSVLQLPRGVHASAEHLRRELTMGAAGNKEVTRS